MRRCVVVTVVAAMGLAGCGDKRREPPAGEGGSGAAGRGAGSGEAVAEPSALPEKTPPDLPALVSLGGDDLLATEGARVFRFSAEPPVELVPNAQWIVAGHGAAYAATAADACRARHGEPVAWTRLHGAGPEVPHPHARLRLIAVDAGDTAWARSDDGLYRLAQQGRRRVRVADFPKLGTVVRSEPKRLLVMDPGTRWRSGTSGSTATQEVVGERRLLAIDKQTGAARELLRGDLGDTRVAGGQLWILLGGTAVLSLAEGADATEPRTLLPEAAVSIEVDADRGVIYFAPAAADRVLAVPLVDGPHTTVPRASGPHTTVIDGLVDAELLGAGPDGLVIGASDTHMLQRLVPPYPTGGKRKPVWFPWSQPRRILSVPKAGGPPRVLAEDQQSLRSRVADAERLYVQVAKCYDVSAPCGARVDDPALWVIDRSTHEARRQKGVGRCDHAVVVGAAGTGVWLESGHRLDQPAAPPIFLGGAGAAHGVIAGDAAFLVLAPERRLVRTTTTELEVLAEGRFGALAVGGAYVYVHDLEQRRIDRFSLQTRQRETVVTDLPPIRVLAADAAGVYWWSQPTRALEAASGPGARRVLLADAPWPRGLAALGGRVALLTKRRLLIVPAGGGAPRTVSLVGTGRGVVASEEHVLWTEADHAAAIELVKLPWSGGERTVIGRVPL